MSLDPDEFDGPVFGEGAIQVQPIRIVVHGPGDPPEGRQEDFNALQDMDAGLMVSVVRARTDAEQLQAAMRLILNVVIDTDGLSAEYQVPLIGPDDERVKAGDAAAGDVDVDDDAYDDRYQNEKEWSSMRRLTTLIDDPRQYIKMTALTDLAQWLVEQASGGRPTTPSRPSSTGPRRSGRGSGARRS